MPVAYPTHLEEYRPLWVNLSMELYQGIMMAQLQEEITHIFKEEYK